ncbi:MAG: CerR family C-terminal domain-containing protein [Planctomycetota bacterium]
MRGDAKSEPVIKQRLLSTASRLFAEHGRDAVSLRRIAADAGVTHGSIRYHFRSKDELYLAAIHQITSVDEMLRPPSEQPPERRAKRKDARSRFRSAVERMVAFQVRASEDRATAMGLLRAEISRDGGPDPSFYKRVIKPGHEMMKALLREVEPKIEDDETLEILAFNVIFQCVMLRIGQGIVLKLLDKPKLEADDVDRIATLIVDVTLGGLRSARP